MSIQLKIAEPQNGASEVATETRESLQQWIESVQDRCSESAVRALSPDRITELVSAGRDHYMSVLAAPDSSAVDGLYNAIRALVGSLSAAAASIEGDPRDASYKVEGVMRAFAKSVFENQWTFTPMHRRVYMDLMSGGQYCTGTSYANTVQYTGGGDMYITPMFNSVFGAQAAITQGFAQQRTDQRWESELLRDEKFMYGFVPREYDLGTAIGYFIVPVGYMDADGPWVAGFLSPDDTARCRFSRKRLGAWLKDSGVYTDEQVRSFVETAKTQTSGGSFVIYPNDVLFGDLYVAGRENVSSCMASPVGEYSTWDDIHPCDVYSTAYHGVGDNGLALVTAEDACGDIIGRGIWNRGTKQIVRWYGDETKFRALAKLGMDRDCDALEGSYLAYINSGSKFIAPYIDGNVEQGKVDESTGRVYLGQEGLYLSETSGVIGVDNVYCIDDDEYHDRDDCTYQSEHNTYVWDDCLDWECAVTGEYVPYHHRTSIWLDGEEVEVSVRVTDRPSQYLREIEPTEEMIEYAEENDEPVPTNYEAR